MDEIKLVDEQIKNFDHYPLTEEQESFASWLSCTTAVLH